MPAINRAARASEARPAAAYLRLESQLIAAFVTARAKRRAEGEQLRSLTRMCVPSRGLSPCLYCHCRRMYRSICGWRQRWLARRPQNASFESSRRGPYFSPPHSHNSYVIVSAKSIISLFLRACNSFYRSSIFDCQNYTKNRKRTDTLSP